MLACHRFLTTRAPFRFGPEFSRLLLYIGPSLAAQSLVIFTTRPPRDNLIRPDTINPGGRTLTLQRLAVHNCRISKWRFFVYE
jgi:hypothetical protein